MMEAYQSDCGVIHESEALKTVNVNQAKLFMMQHYNWLKLHRWLNEKKRNSSALAMELCLFCIKPLTSDFTGGFTFWWGDSLDTKDRNH